MDEDKLPGKEYKKTHPGSCELDEPWIHPKDHGVTYNDDTGLCNYTDDFCNFEHYSYDNTTFFNSLFLLLF